MVLRKQFLVRVSKKKLETRKLRNEGTEQAVCRRDDEDNGEIALNKNLEKTDMLKSLESFLKTSDSQEITMEKDTFTNKNEYDVSTDTSENGSYNSGDTEDSDIDDFEDNISME